MVHERLQSSEAPKDRSVAIEGRLLGRELGELSLRQFSKKGKEEGVDMLGGDRFSEIYIETESGNIYRLQEKSDTGKWILINSRENAGKGAKTKLIELPEMVLERGVLKEGGQFLYGQGQTSRIKKITGVNGLRYYGVDALQEMTGGVTSEVRKKFVDTLRGPQEKK